jgi:hypothetical protein
MLVPQERVEMQRDLWGATARPSLFVCPNPSHTAMREMTEGINELIPMTNAVSRRQLTTKGEGSVMVPGPLKEEVPVGRNQIGLLS